MDTFHHGELLCDVIGVLQGQKDFLNFSNNSQEVINASFTFSTTVITTFSADVVTQLCSSNGNDL